VVDSSPDSSPHFEDSNSNPKDSDLESDSKAKDSHSHPRKLIAIMHVFISYYSYNVHHSF